MESREERRQTAIERMTEFLLKEGLGAATLRPLAAAAGISDRMLLYYFKDRDEILTATLHHYVQRMLAQLDLAVPPGKRRDFLTLFNEVGVVLGRDDVQSSMHLWLDLAAGASRGLQPHREIAKDIADRFMGWLSTRLIIEEDTRQQPTAALFLTMIEGMHILSAFGRADLGQTAMTDLTRFLPEPRNKRARGKQAASARSRLRATGNVPERTDFRL